MTQLSGDVIRNIIAYLEYTEILALIKHNKYLNLVLDTEGFWKTFLRRSYFIKDLIEGKTAKQTTEFVVDMLNIMEEKEHYATYRALSFLIKLYDEKWTHVHVGNWGNQLIMSADQYASVHDGIPQETGKSSEYYENLCMKYYVRQFKDIDLPIIKISKLSGEYEDVDRLSNFNEYEKLLLNQIMELCHRKTWYITSKGKIQIDYDKDLFEYILKYIYKQNPAKRRAKVDVFGDYLHENMFVYERLVILRYFAKIYV